MFSPEKQQVEICLLKSNLEEIENDLVAQVRVINYLFSIETFLRLHKYLVHLCFFFLKEISDSGARC